MRAFTSLAIAVFAAVVSASNTDNPFNVPKDGYTFTVGQPTTLHWTPTTSGTVSLRLQHGDVTTSNTGTSIVSGIPNDGSYTWTVPSDVTGQPYTIEILSDNNANDYNFLPMFTINGVTAASSSSAAPTTSSSSSAVATSTPESSTSTTSSSASTTTTKTTKTTMTTSTSTSASAKTTSSESSTSAQPTKTQSSTSASAVTSTASVPTTNAGINNRVSGGMLAMVAGAIALL